MNSRIIGTFTSKKYAGVSVLHSRNQQSTPPYEIVHVRKPRFPSELPVEEEDDPSPIALQWSHPNAVADYVSSKREQLSAMKAKVCLRPLTITFIVETHA